MERKLWKVASCGRADSNLISLFSGTGPAHPSSPQFLVSLDSYGRGPFITHLEGGILPRRSLTARKFFLVSSPGALLSPFFRARVLGGGL